MLAVIGAVLDVIRWGIFHPAAGVPLAVLGRVTFAHFRPYRTCRWCRPGGLIGGSIPFRMAAARAGYEPSRRRKRGCWRCKGTRLTRHLGAYHVHKVRLALIRAREERGG